MLFGVLGFVLGLFVGGSAVFFAFALVVAGKDEEAARRWNRYEDDLK